MIAAVGNTPYNIALVVHIGLAIVAFAPAFVHPLLAKQSKGMEDGARRALLNHVAGNGRRIYSPALILAGLAGFAVSGMSDGVYALSQGWLVASMVIWIAMNGILHGMVIPAERAMAAGDDSAETRLDIGGSLMTLLLIVTLVLMVFKPGQ